MTTKRALPAAAPGKGDRFHPIGRSDAKRDSHAHDEPLGTPEAQAPAGKSMYMAAGSSIPEIKTVPSGFVIPHLLDFNVLVVKAAFVDRTPLTICAKAPMEYALEMFGKLGLRYLCVLEEGSGKLVGVIIKKRLVVWLDGLKG